MKLPNIFAFLLNLFSFEKKNHSGEAGTPSPDATNLTFGFQPGQAAQPQHANSAMPAVKVETFTGSPHAGIQQQETAAAFTLSPVGSEKPTYGGFPGTSYGGFPGTTYGGFPGTTYGGFPGTTYGGFPGTSYGGFPVSGPAPTYGGFPAVSSYTSQSPTVPASIVAASSPADGGLVTPSPDPVNSALNVPLTENTDPLKIQKH